MVSSVQPRPNYYDVLGLSPSANQEEIRRAFAKLMGMFGAHPLAAAAEVSAAFETLRNPVKRHAYDDALGLKRDATPQQWTMTIPGRSTRGFVASAPGPAEKASSEALALLARLAQPQPLAGSPEVTARPPAPTQPQPQPLASEASTPPAPLQRNRHEQSDARLGTHIETMLAAHDQERDDQPLAWMRPAMAVGGLLIAAGLIGALAGSSAMESGSPAKPKASVGRPKRAAPMPASNGSSSTQIAERVEVKPAPLQPAAAPVQRAHPVRHMPEPVSGSQAAASADGAPASDQIAENGPDATAASAAAASSAGAPAAVATIASAGLPLAGKLMARTIERIGYACGEVASATPVDGRAGAYKVTCTSGDTYRAAPQHGRYHFRRWARQ